MASVAAFAATACATPDRPPPSEGKADAKAAVVQVLAFAPPPECERLGRVSGQEEAYGFFPDMQPKADLKKGAEKKAEGQAAELGATHVVFDDRQPPVSGGKAVAWATAYRCPPPAASPEAAPATPPGPTAGCGKDTDCKGDRICEAGVCVDPRPPPRSAGP
jgi:hypothetical protein